MARQPLSSPLKFYRLQISKRPRSRSRIILAVDFYLYSLIYFRVSAFGVCSLIHQCFISSMYHFVSQKSIFYFLIYSNTYIWKNKFMLKVLHETNSWGKKNQEWVIPGNAFLLLDLNLQYCLSCLLLSPIPPFPTWAWNILENSWE